MKAWVRFGKLDRVRFVSHLDLQRFFQRALNRTGLPIAFSQGFNPHPVMSFASALAVGWTSEYEIVEFGLAAPMGRTRVQEQVASALPQDLPVLGVRLVDDRFPASMSLVRAADYRITLPGSDIAPIAAAAGEYLKRQSVMAMRKTKSGEREIDIRPLTLSLTQEGDAFLARLMLTEKDTLKPDLLMRALAEIAGIAPSDMRIHRLALLGEDKAGTYGALMGL